MNGGSDVTVDQAQAVRAIDGVGLVDKTETKHRAVEPVAGPVAGKDAASTVATMGGWSQSDNQEAGTRFAKAGDRATPIILIAESADPVTRDLFPVFDQARAAAAVENVSLGGPLCHLG